MAASSQSLPGLCSKSGASGRELAGWGGGGRGEKRKEAPGASETKRVRPGTWENRVTNTPRFKSVEAVTGRRKEG